LTLKNYHNAHLLAGEAGCGTGFGTTIFLFFTTGPSIGFSGDLIPADLLEDADADADASFILASIVFTT
jgi:hypothetical protein